MSVDDLYSAEKFVSVPTLNGHKFSENNAWAESVRGVVAAIDAKYREDHGNDGTQIDRVWVVLMALPDAKRVYDKVVALKEGSMRDE